MRDILRVIPVVLVVGVVGGTALSLRAQTVVINPTTVQFVKSADHDATLPGATPPVALVTRYELEVWPQAGTQPLRVVDLGKPEPNAAGAITVTNPDFFNVPTGAYRCYVRAVGPGGVGRSEASAVWFAIREAPAAPGSPIMRGQ